MISIRVAFSGQRPLNQLRPPIPSRVLKRPPRQLGYLRKLCVKDTPHRRAAIGENRWPTMVDIISNYQKIRIPVDWETPIFNWPPFLNG
jgi:hypothetical protein